MGKDFYWEYMQRTDDIVEKFISAAMKINEEIFQVGKASMKKATANYLWEILFFSNRREKYNQQRISGENGDTFFQKLWDECLSNLLPDKQYLPPKKVNADFGNCACFKSLIECRQRIVFFCKNHRQLLYYQPVFRKLAGKVVVLARYEVPDEFEFNENIKLIEINSLTNEVYYDNDYLKNVFPVIFEMANTYTLLLNLLKPKAVILLEGCHFETEVLSGLCNANLAPTICMQQGWPSLMHTRFKDMTYNYFLTWGESFNSLWKKYNAIPTFKDIGYFYKVNNGASKTGLTFFLQAPIFILDETYLQMQLEFAKFCAETFYDRVIYIREHPEYKLTKSVKKELLHYANIKVATDMPLPELFSLSEVGISAFSSTLIEAIIHETIPFIFNPTSYPGYYPDLHKKGLGIEVKSLNEAKDKMKQLINTPVIIELIRKNIRKERSKYFTAIDNMAAENAVNFITLIAEACLKFQFHNDSV